MILAGCCDCWKSCRKGWHCHFSSYRYWPFSCILESHLNDSRCQGFPFGGKIEVFLCVWTFLTKKTLGWNPYNNRLFLVLVMIFLQHQCMTSTIILYLDILVIFSHQSFWSLSICMNINIKLLIGLLKRHGAFFVRSQDENFRSGICGSPAFCVCVCTEIGM